MSSPENKVNFNSILLTILLGLGAWTLNRVNNLGEQVIIATERNSNQASMILDLRSRIASIESQVQENKLQIMKITREIR